MSAPLSHLSRHFLENWEKRVGGQASLEGVRRLIDQAVKIQHCKDLVDRAGQSCRQLAVYWHQELGIVVTIDHIEETAVSVYTSDMPHRKKGFEGPRGRGVKG